MLENWLDNFRNHWKEQNLDGIRSLFADEVIYWETPFAQIIGLDQVMSEWQAIRNQEDIIITTEEVLTKDNTSVIKWNLQYSRDVETHKWAGMYLLTLNEVGKCVYFYQVGEKA